MINRTPMTPELAEAARQRQAEFFARTGSTEPLRALFNHLPNHRFFIKSPSGHFITTNKFNLRRLGLATESDLLGLTDEHAHPPAVARLCRQDDVRIMRTGKPLINHVEMLFHNERSHWEWGCTTKLAMMADDGRVIGIIGVSYPAVAPTETADEGLVLLARLVAEIEANHGQALKVDELARSADLSPRRLNQLFQQTYHMGTQQFIIHTRVQASVQTLLRTRMSLGDVALEHGFSDQSAFTRHFRRIMGQTPQEFRFLRIGVDGQATADFIKNSATTFKNSPPKPTQG